MNKPVMCEYISPNLKEDTINIEWRFSVKCNYDCSYCMPLLHNNNTHVTTFEEMKIGIRNIKKTNPGKKITIALAGGEPFIHPRILDILKMLKKEGVVKIHISTNLSLPADTYIKSFEWLDALTTSFHFENTDTQIFKTKFLKISKSISSDKNIKFLLLLCPGKLSETEEIIKWLNENNIRYSVRKIKPLYRLDNNKINQSIFNGGVVGSKAYPKYTGLGWDTDHNNYYNTKELELLDTFKNSYTNLLGYDTDGNEYKLDWNYLPMQNKNNFMGWECFIGVHSFLIHENGDIYRENCGVGGLIGNIFISAPKIDQPVICPHKWCNCGFGLEAHKRKLK